MSDPRTPMSQDQVDARRRRARRTAWWLAGLAVAVYAGFLLMGVLGQ